MSRLQLVLLVCLAVLLQLDGHAASLKFSRTTIADPHLFFSSPKCTDCHQQREGSGALIEHEFVFDIIAYCAGCHGKDKIGRSHPVLVSPKRAKITVPDYLPLDSDGLLSCCTCHNPHLKGFSRNKPTPEAKPAYVIAGDSGSVPYYTTYYLRVPGDGEQGFVGLCRTCHEDM